MRLPLDHLGPPGCWINRQRRGGGVTFMNWIFMLPPNQLVKVTVLPYGEVRLSDEVMRVEPRDGLVSLWEGEVSGALSTSLLRALSRVRIQQEGSHLWARKRALTRIQPHWHPDLRVPAPGLWETNVCCVSHSGCGTWLQQPQLWQSREWCDYQGANGSAT